MWGSPPVAERRPDVVVGGSKACDLLQGSLAAFAAASAVALAVTLVAISQPWVADVDDVARSLVTRWLPFAFVVATLLTALVAIHLDDARRKSFLLRHFALYLSVPALLLFLRLGPVSNGELGVIYIGIGFGF